MATVAAMAVREANARDRIRLAAGRLGKRLDLDATVETPFIRDTDLRKIAELEAHADFLETLDGAIKGKGFSAAPGNEGERAEPEAQVSDLPADVSAEVTQDGTPVVVTEDDEPSNAEKLESIGFNAAGFPKKPRRVKIVDANTGEQLNKDEDK